MVISQTFDVLLNGKIKVEETGETMSDTGGAKHFRFRQTVLAERSVAGRRRIYDRMRSLIPPIEWPAFAGDNDATLNLKRHSKRRHPGAQLSDAGDLP